MRTHKCDHPGCTRYADYKVVVVHLIEQDDYKYRWLCAQHYAEEKGRSHNYEYNISETVPDDSADDDEEVVPY